ncbi:helix-turn-helix transcriptional regulator [Moorena sp. SIO3A2]|uniref:helix-turn-helix domain-containing protein n=1 Tax=Moorena sp. SIO3A2 TaxID=2607841 RepID=UPI0013B5C292|nr:helix-turn-helix transcriptional regulator [Moorena sp. SIO3A2]NER90397.1 helix-turn-helix transcriptional regulator [Moorena sp. SIO3A2]
MKLKIVKYIDIPGLGKRIRTDREALGYTRKQAGEKLGVTRSFLAHVENERTCPTIAMLKKIENLYMQDYIPKSLLDFLDDVTTLQNSAIIKETTHQGVTE